MEQEKNSQQKKPDLVQKTKTLRTYEGDIQDAMKKDQVSLTKIAMAERSREGRGESVGTNAETNPGGKKRLLIWLIVVVVLGLLAYGGFLIYQKKQVDINIKEASKPGFMISVDSESEIEINPDKKNSIVDAIQKENSASFTISNVKGIYVKENGNYIDAKKFFALLGANLPEQLSRAILKDLTIGIHTFDGNHPFFIFKTDSYENAFTGILDWEDDMASKFVPILDGRQIQSSEKTSFKDALVKNIDVRILKSEDGTLLLVYLFIDKDTLLVTNSDYTVEEIVKRVNAYKLKR